MTTSEDDMADDRRPDPTAAPEPHPQTLPERPPSEDDRAGARRPAPPAAPEPHPRGRAIAMLAMATVGFAVNFWAWALLSPLGPRFKDLLSLTPGQQAFLVAVP